MSNARFRFHPEAREGLRAAIRWYRDPNRAVAAEFRVTVSEVIGQIVQAPKRWQNICTEPAASF